MKKALFVVLVLLVQNFLPQTSFARPTVSFVFSEAGFRLCPENQETCSPVKPDDYSKWMMQVTFRSRYSDDERYIAIMSLSLALNFLNNKSVYPEALSVAKMSLQYDSDPGVRYLATGIICHVGSKEDVPFLKEMSEKEKEDSVKVQILHVIRVIAKRENT